MPKIIINKKWYKDTQINALLKFYLAKYPDVEMLTAMLGTDWLASDENGISVRGNVLKVNLEQFKSQTTTKVIIPINLNNDHWVLIYLTYNAGKPTTVYYFDPKGNAISTDVVKAIRSVYTEVEICSLDSKLQASSDSDNCGVYVVEAARSLVVNGALPNVNIMTARAEHEAILSYATLNKRGLFSASARSKAFNIIDDAEANKYAVAIKYFENYLDGINDLINTAVKDKDSDLLLAIKLQNEALSEFLDGKKENSNKNRIR